MGEREWRWTAAGLASAAHNGVDPVEVIEAAFSSHQYFNDYGHRIIVCAPAVTGRLITFSADKWAPELAVYLIVKARSATSREQALWRGRFL